MKEFLRSPWGYFLPIIFIGLAASWLIPTCARHDAPTHPPAADNQPAPAPAPPPSHTPDRPALSPVAPAASFPRSPLAHTLNSPSTTAADDLRVIGRILALYRERFGSYPSFGDNAQLVNALAGANPHRIPLLARDAAAVSAKTGELIDRWGSPYVFHSISRVALEIRSPGPDREPYTPDDLVAPIGFAGVEHP